MKHIIVSAVVAGMALSVAGASPSLAKTDCKKDISEFDAAVKKSTASKADLEKAMKLRDEANKDCEEKGGSVKGDADMQEAHKLIGIK